MIYRVELSTRAIRDLRQIYDSTNARDSVQARAWFNGLETLIWKLDQHPARGAVIAETPSLRQLLFGNKPHTYRIIYSVDERQRRVIVRHIRHGARSF